MGCLVVRSIRTLSPAFALVAASCSPFAVELSGRPCEEGSCVSGYVCSPITDTCVPQVEIGCGTGPGNICPDDITEGASCEHNGSFVPCVSGVTDCSSGCRFCSNGAWSACGGIDACDPTKARTRPCYPFGDGVTDPTAGVGACIMGEQVCSDPVSYGVGVWSDCQGAVGPAPTETCGNNIDDDCNGIVDDGCDCNPGETQPCYDGPAGTEGVGLCTGGTQDCVDHRWGPCTGQVLPAPETCDGQDEDCNGMIDDGPAPPATSPCPQQGVCLGAPLVCNGASGWSCNPANYEAVEATCDGLDNDCDGLVDNNLTVPEGLCTGLGLCGEIEPRCHGANGWRCFHPALEPDGETLCDGLDNDCDGSIDEGVCAACEDGIDNDGDGFIDLDDPGCTDASDDDESEPLPDPEETCFQDNPPLTVGEDGFHVGTTQNKGPNYSGSCSLGTYSGPDVVYEVVLPAGADGLWVSTNFVETTFDSVVYFRSNCDDPDTELGCADDVSFADGNPRSTLFYQGALAPGRYWVFVDAAGKLSGAYKVQISALLGVGRACDPSKAKYLCLPDLACLPTPKGQHTCQPATCEAIPVDTSSFVMDGNTSAASDIYVGSCEHGRTPEHVYVLSLDTTVKEVVASTNHPQTLFDTMMFIREGCLGAELGCHDDVEGPDGPSEITVGPVGPGDFYIFVTGWGGEVGPYRLSVTVTP